MEPIRNSKKTKVDLITGFLGAGKTTFVKNYAAYCASNKEHFIIIENEFGKAGVDARILSTDNYEVDQLVGGCICCGQKVNFHDRILALAGHYDRIIVEPSGIYTLEDFYEIMESPPVHATCEIGTILTILDPAQLTHLSESAKKICYSQTAGASVLLFNQKTEDSNHNELDCMHTIQTLWNDYGCRKRQVKHISMFTNCAISTPALYEKIQNAPSYRNDQSLEKEDHSYIYQSITIQPDFVQEEQLVMAVKKWLSGACGNLIRVKGFLTVGKQDVYEINCTPETFHICRMKQPSEEPLPSALGLNLIGDHINRAEIYKCFR